MKKKRKKRIENHIEMQNSKKIPKNLKITTSQLLFEGTIHINLSKNNIKLEKKRKKEPSRRTLNIKHDRREANNFDVKTLDADFFFLCKLKRLGLSQLEYLGFTKD